MLDTVYIGTQDINKDILKKLLGKGYTRTIYDGYWYYFYFKPAFASKSKQTMAILLLSGAGAQSVTSIVQKELE